MSVDERYVYRYRRVGKPEENARRTQTVVRRTRAQDRRRRFVATAAAAAAIANVVVARRVAGPRGRRAHGRQTVRAVQSFAVRVVSTIRI